MAPAIGRSGETAGDIRYFGDPEDILPDHIPVIGYLDDVIMIELVVRELAHVRDAYDDFCDYQGQLRPPLQVRPTTRPFAGIVSTASGSSYINE